MIFLSPAITMRLLAEEQKIGTLELLLTSPVREFEIVVGKFLAAFVTVLAMLVLSLYFVIILFVYGIPDVGPILTGYLGLVLYAAATLAIGLFASALSPNQIVGLCCRCRSVDSIDDHRPSSPNRVTGVASEILDALQLGASFSVFDLDSFGVAESGHFADFARGILSVGDVVYYLSITAVFLMLTVIALETRRWR